MDSLDFYRGRVNIAKIPDDTNTKLKSLEEENFKLGARIKEEEEEEEDQHLYLQAYSRCENLKFANVPENVASGEDTGIGVKFFSHLAYFLGSAKLPGDLLRLNLSSL